MRTALRLAAGFIVLSVASVANAATESCREQLSVAATSMGFLQPKRGIEPDDLLRLRDIGQVSPHQVVYAPLFSLSPDGLSIAFTLRRADPDTNSYCLGVFVMKATPGARPTLVDEGGEVIRETGRTADWGNLESGYIKTIVPRWSPDSRTLLYLRRDEGITQAWTVHVNDARAVAVTHSSVDVEGAAWSADGMSVVYSSRPGLLKNMADLKAEALSGYVYDRRNIPTLSIAPLLPNGVSTEITALRVVDGSTRPAAPDEKSLLQPGNEVRGFDSAIIYAAAKGARGGKFSLPPQTKIETGSSDPTERYAATGLRFETDKGWRQECVTAPCDQVFGLWIDSDSKSFLYLRREGWRGLQTGIYRWRFGARAPQRVMLTEDTLLGCMLAQAGLVCGQENATQPRRLVVIDPRQGRMTTLFDPNPEFAAVQLGEVKTLKYVNSLGLRARAKLVLPPNRKADERVPLVVVQYVNRGFLRGGVGDDYPIYLLAARGMAVLAVDRPESYAYLFPSRDPTELNRREHEDWADMRSVYDALDAGLRQAIDLGVADPSRVGITGLSNGAQLVQFALSNHSDRFAAAAMSSCCDDEYAMSYIGPAGMARLRARLYPEPTTGQEYFRPMSLVVNAARITTPLLIQSADREALNAMPTVARLQSLGKPVDMIIYPDEHHNKWQPAHRAATYKRNVDWFDFWLNRHEDPDPAKATQYERWRAMRDRLAKPANLAVAPDED